MQLQQHHCQPDWQIAMHLLHINVEPKKLIGNCKNCGKDVTYRCPEPDNWKVPPSKMQNSCRPRVCEGCGKEFTPPSNTANRMTACMECRDDVRNQKRRAYRAREKAAREL